MPTFKIAFVFNNTRWVTEGDKIANIAKFFSPDFVLNITVTHTDFTNIPFVNVSALGGITNTVGTTKTVDSQWYEKNITPMFPDYDAIVFVVDPANIPPQQTSVGIMQGKVNKVIQCCIFAINETDHAYINMVDQGNCFELFSEHELCHAFCLIENVPDNTHLYFYSGQPTKMLSDLQNGELNWLQNIIARLKQQLLNIQTSQTKIMPQPQQSAPTTPPVVTVSTYPQKIINWANAIAHEEGADPASHNQGNLKFTSLTESWGAIKGRAATDGGNLCVFANDEAGMNALCNFLVLGCKNELLAFHQSRTFQSFTQVYAGNPPMTYITNIAAAIPCQLTTDVSTFLS